MRTHVLYCINRTVKLSGHTIHFDLRVTKNKKSYGSLKHHIVAAYIQVPVEEIVHEKILFKKSFGKMDRGDIRIENLKCDMIPFLKSDFSTSRKGDELVIICRKNGHVYYTDYEPSLYELLNDDRVRFHVKGRDGRLAVRIPGGGYEYLYHLVMAESLYRHDDAPVTKDGFAQIMGDFRSNYIEAGIEVDHLDGDVTNNRAENLILMDSADNKRKSALFQKIKLPHFCLWEKYDNISVKMQCGSYAAAKKPTYFVNGVYSIAEALSELQRFVEQIHFERIAMTEGNLIHCPTTKKELEELKQDDKI